MEEDSNANNSRRSRSSFQDAQGHWYSHLTSPTSTTTTTMSTSTVTSGQEQTEEEKEEEETICTETTLIPMDDDNNENRSQQSVATIRIHRLSEEWLPSPSLPLATSTPLVVAPNMLHSQQADEDELFTNIEQLIQDFAQQPNRRYPLTRIIQWMVGNEPRMEYVVVVVINRPTIIL